MKRPFALILAACLLTAPLAHAQDDEDETSESESPPKKERAPKDEAASKKQPAVEEERDSESEVINPAELLGKFDAPKITSGRIAFVAGGVFLGGGMALGYFAQGQAKRAGSLDKARDTRLQLRQAEATAQTANLMYLLAGAAIAYGLVLEILPEPIASKANLTFHF